MKLATVECVGQIVPTTAGVNCRIKVGFETGDAPKHW